MSDDQKSAQNLRAAAEEFRLWDVWDIEAWPAKAYTAIHTVADQLDEAADRIEALEAEVERLRDGATFDTAISGPQWSAARKTLVRMLFRLAEQKGEKYEAMLDIAASEILKAALSADKTKEE